MEQPDPREIGQAIDTAIEELEQLAAVTEQRDRLLEKVKEMEEAIRFTLDNFSSKTLPAHSREFLKSL